MCQSVLHRASGRCWECQRIASRSLIEYQCYTNTRDWGTWGGRCPSPGRCDDGWDLRNAHAPIENFYPDRDQTGRQQFMPFPCDVCQERNDQAERERAEYEQEEAVAGPDIPDLHPMQPPRQVDIIRNWETFGGPNPEDLLLQYTLDGIS